jgi:hypothetical protein
LIASSLNLPALAKRLTQRKTNTSITVQIDEIFSLIHSADIRFTGMAATQHY